MQRYQINPTFILREIAGEAILVPTGDAGVFTNSMISLNPTSLFLWKQFEEPRTVDEVVEKAKSIYEDPSGRMEDEIRQFVSEYIRANLLREVLTDE